MEESEKNKDKQENDSISPVPSQNAAFNIKKIIILWVIMQAGMWCLGLLVLNVILPGVLGTESLSKEDGDKLIDFWIVRLLVNILGYATIFVPGYLLIRYFRKIRFNETGGNDYLGQIVKLCVFGKEAERISLEEGGSLHTSAKPDAEKEKTLFQKAVLLLFCFLGLQVAYLTWGLLQERIMTYEYGQTETSPGEYFKNSQFLVFINRILAFIIGCTVLTIQRPQPRHTAPLFKYSYSSFSNIMSSWCQYEALKFVSFPTQVLAKASKVIPVMLMGKIVSKRTYEYHEYLTALLISFGVSMFLLTSGDVTKNKESVTTFSGVILLGGYMLFDSFTSNWQGELFRSYKMSPIQMMTGVNMFSCLLTSVSLAEQGGFMESVTFMTRHSTFVVHAVILSLCSAVGQLFIFYTISKFGPVTFTIIMTMRQGFAILLSCIIYGHPVTLLGILGVIVVFFAMFMRIYANERQKAISRRRQAAASSDISKV